MPIIAENIGSIVELFYMEPPTQALVAGGIAVIVSGTMISRLITHFKRPQTAKEAKTSGHTRAAEREEHWYALDQPMIIDKSPFEKPLE
jgi:hypothetical protein